MANSKSRAKRSSIYVRRRRRERLILLVLVLVLLVIGIIATRTAISSPYESVDMCDLVELSYSGYDGAGTVEAILDDNAVDMLLSNVKSEYEDSLFKNKDVDNEDYLKFRQSLAVSVDNSTNLKNGNIINLVCDYDEDLAKLLKIKVVAKDRQVTVQGLPGVIPISVDELFKNLQVSFVGVSPNLTISMHNQSENPFIKRVGFEIVDPKEYYSAGDIVTIKANFSEQLSIETQYVVDANIEDCVREYEAVASTKYVDSVSDLPESIISEAIEAGKRAFKDANEYGVRIFCEANLVPVYIDKKATFVYGSPKLVSAYFKTVRKDKAGQLGIDYNDLDIIYSVVITQADGVACTAYAAVRFSDIIENDDGSFDYDFSNPSILSESYFAERVKKNVSDSYMSTHEVTKIR